MWRLRLLEDCANIAAKPQKSSKAGTKRSNWSLTGFRTFGESKFNVCSHAHRDRPRHFPRKRIALVAEGARKREPQMCNCTSGNLEIPGSLVSRAPRSDS